MPQSRRADMKIRFLAPFAAALLFVASPQTGRAAGHFLCDAAGSRENVRLASVNERLDVVLADGRLIYFPTLEPPRATPAAPERPKSVAEQLTSLLAGKTLALQKLGGPDRWGRIPALLFVDGETDSVDQVLVAVGLAMVSAESGTCGAKAIRAAEAGARADSLGIWADPAFAVLALDDSPDLAGRAGTLALVEGRVSSVGRTKPRLYLNFGSRRGGLSLTIARRNLRLFERAGFSEKSLVHKFIRARGVVEIGAFPQIELFHPDQIEFIEDRL